jgi:hypothetical protein
LDHSVDAAWAGKTSVTWAIDSDQVEVQASTEPTYNLKCSTKPISIRSFLQYLESNKQSNVSLANHQVKRQADGSYQITQDDTCKYVVTAVGSKDKTSSQNLVNHLDLDAVQASPLLKLVMRVKYVEKRRAIEPGRFALFLKKPIRLVGAKLVRLL